MSDVKRVIGVILAITALLLVSLLPAKVSAINIPDEDTVTICHRTNSVKNPYVRLSVSVSALDGEGKNDHTSHTGPVATSEPVAQALKDNKQSWGDIIPSEADGGVGDGLNWDAVGKAVYNEGNCSAGEITEVVPAVVTFIDPTCSTKGSYTIPTTANIEYTINSIVIVAGTYEVANGTSLTVIAEAGEDYFVADGTTDSWSHTYNAPTNCGSVLGTQVKSTPVGGVSTGEAEGSSSAAVVTGLVGSIMALAAGLAIRRKTV